VEDLDGSRLYVSIQEEEGGEIKEKYKERMEVT
jgi:hypothetical protein